MTPPPSLIFRRTEHQPNERVSIIKLLQAAEVYRRAFTYLVLAD